MSRNKSVDIAKGLGIILIVWGHTVCPFRNQIYLFHVALFIILSGILFNYNVNVNSEQYILKKFHSLVIPYLRYFVLGILVWFLSTFHKISLHDIFRIINITNPQDNGAIWFLLSLFYANLLYFFIIKYSYKRIRDVIVIICCLIGISMKFNILFIDQALVMIMFYHIGYTFKNVFLTRNQSFLFVNIIVFLYGLILTIHSHFYINIANMDYGNNIIYYYLFGVSGSYIIIYLSILIAKYRLGKYIAIIGMNSLTILGTHFIFIKPINSFYQSYLKNCSSNVYLENSISGLYSIGTLMLTIYCIVYVKTYYKNRIKS